jgi:hypothetical protein
VTGEAVREQSEPLFERSGGVIRILRRKAIAVAINWTGAGVPELGNVLGGVAENSVLPQEGIQG